MIVVRGPNLFSGYWPDGRDGPDADGWWSTGDIAYSDADGDLFLVDRLGELIIVSGFNVYPHEVELVLASHPAVVEAAAVGMPHPYTRQTVRAYVVRAPRRDGHRRGAASRTAKPTWPGSSARPRWSSCRAAQVGDRQGAGQGGIGCR